MDEVKYMMWGNDKVVVALRQYFNVESTAILSVDTKKEKKAFAKFIKSNQKCTGAIKATFVSALCDLFVALINVLQYGESQYTKPTMHNAFVRNTPGHNGFSGRTTMDVLQYGESQYTKPTTISLEIHQDIMDFVEETPWILKMPLDHRATSRTLQDKDKKHGE